MTNIEIIEEALTVLSDRRALLLCYSSVLQIKALLFSLRVWISAHLREKSLKCNT